MEKWLFMQITIGTSWEIVSMFSGTYQILAGCCLADTGINFNVFHEFSM